MTKRISDQEIVSCGWIPEKVTVYGNWIDGLDELPEDAIQEEDRTILNGYILNKGNDVWYEMFKKTYRLCIIQKWIRGGRVEWDTVLDAPISTAEELMNEMSWLNIIKKDDKGTI